VSDTPAEPISAGDAPWLDDPTAWEIDLSPLDALRPGDFVFDQTANQFVRVMSAARTPLNGEQRWFIDLADGRTLAGSGDVTVTARRFRSGRPVT
jgi:hypothetical protein